MTMKVFYVRIKKNMSLFIDQSRRKFVWVVPIQRVTKTNKFNLAPIDVAILNLNNALRKLKLQKVVA